VDLVRSIYAAWERGDFSSADWAHPDVDFEFVGGPEPGRWSGLGTMAVRFRDFLSTWEDWRVEAQDYRELDAERVLVLVSFSARGKTSGFAVEQAGARGANLFHIRGGKVTRFVIYWERDRALAELGDPAEARSHLI
jgi:ketosteroid isomerase-like protein